MKKIKDYFNKIRVYILYLPLIVFISFAGCAENDSAEKINTVNTRIDGLEKRFAKVEKKAHEFQEFIIEANKYKDTLEQQLTVMSEKLDNATKKESSVGTTPEVKQVNKKKPSAKEIEKKYHKVQVGETLFKISKKYNVSIATLRRINNIKKDLKIYPGQKLLVSPDNKK